ncbi:protein EPIDERMAL PATTERNING FACTOR 1 [Lotus japonicus]|uniref:protein EPIDERMAL PATTERNING FACTOR 1 n=1 Tax=Lotus japonicus TaxID=34305 RepID=UPI00258498B6|nr:protein EPIDERMAL PATTERNING FACTOR 1 [Lotus japonicus]
MRRSSVYAAVVLLLLYTSLIISARHISHSHSRGHGGQRVHWGGKVPTKHRKGPDTMQVAGSRLPDCSHACGSCSPCRLVMVSFVCASIAEAESCPMAYKCMCHNKSYPVP